MNASTPSLAPARFADLGVPRALCDVLEQKGITSPFPIQAATLPDCLAGRDVCGRAPTGAGKTLAFGLAILTRLAATPRAARRGRRHPSALVLVPTRELAAQIEDVVAPLASAIGAKVVSIYGGVGYGKQLAALRGGVDVLVACPGRLTDLIERSAVDLSHVNMVVVDEADRMADMGFLPAVRRLIDKTDTARQSLLFSATLDGPVDKLIRDYQRDPARHDVELADADRGDVSHHFWRVEANDRIAVTTEAVTARGPAVVFCRTKRGADRLSERLTRSGLASAPIHGNRTQGQRERALAAFRAGRLDVLVATDIAARGIHVDAVPLVVHFDPPADATDYVHRSGRTGRAGADGTVVSLIGSEHLAMAKLIQRRLGLSSGVSSPDVRSLAVRGEGVRTRPDTAPNGAGARGGTEVEAPRGIPSDGVRPRGSSPRAKATRGAATSAKRPQGTSGTGAAARDRSSRRRGPRASWR
ncbi:MAG TPA: DEAD/DEAH box helicase [Acidimicrobiales bacterium]|nr:DEAD/DEAH box helicase [Acidimicrobiales bacterium]